MDDISKHARHIGEQAAQKPDQPSVAAANSCVDDGIEARPNSHPTNAGKISASRTFCETQPPATMRVPQEQLLVSAPSLSRDMDASGDAAATSAGEKSVVASSVCDSKALASEASRANRGTRKRKRSHPVRRVSWSSLMAAEAGSYDARRRQEDAVARLVAAPGEPEEATLATATRRLSFSAENSSPRIRTSVALDDLRFLSAELSERDRSAPPAVKRPKTSGRKTAARPCRQTSSRTSPAKRRVGRMQRGADEKRRPAGRRRDSAAEKTGSTPSGAVANSGDVGSIGDRSVVWYLFFIFSFFFHFFFIFFFFLYPFIFFLLFHMLSQLSKCIPRGIL